MSHIRGAREDFVSIGANGDHKWGRIVGYTNSLGDTTTTTYVAPSTGGYQAGAGQVATVTDAKSVTSYTYGGTDARGGTESRSLLTKKVVAMVGGSSYTFTAAYDTFGALIKQIAPNDVGQTNAYDSAGRLAGMSYYWDATGASPLLHTWTREYDAADRVTGEYDMTAIPQPTDYPTRWWRYDKAGRLDEIVDRSSGVCVIRQYSFDKQGNRTALTSSAAQADGNCWGAASTTTWTYDLSSRVRTVTKGGVTGSYGYDVLGRVTTIPGLDAASSGTRSIGYFDNDLPRTVVDTSFTLDPSMRRVQGTDGSVTHYGDTTDSPSWVVKSGTTTVYAADIAGALSLQYDTTGSGSTGYLQLANPHGDNVTRTQLPAAAGTDASTVSGFAIYDEFGQATGTTASTGAVKYGWLGSKQRQTTGPFILMGVRVYNPITGRFTSPDPVPGGNENTYNYPGDPINAFDGTGEYSEWDLALDIGLTALMFVAGVGVLAVAARVAVAVVRIAKVVTYAARIARTGEAVTRTFRMTELDSKIAGGIWTGRGSYSSIARNGAKMRTSKDGSHAYRAPATKGSGRSSDLTYEPKGRHDRGVASYRNIHISHGRGR
ncbi:RHS repeat-associated core domain-containing protein [Galbitalea sp. SE-J8]|uniref:RHS repeat-associated core domain-containing protein n=1 Tax=Galbitalea sp. SE-J8 TaxID=3054952 RepID=UPI00259D0A66|nr:RHS repeat-associated core domain-containing protein [Galbitalea sp. SE-J8]MDM4764387.1 RHS repeat-associated core domain-containing protein [Galbitalea sp. SE-J8]